MRRLGFLLLLPALAGCVAPPSPAERVTESARALNLAARFGRIDLALERTADGARDHFVRRRNDWGNEIRVLDFELAGLNMRDHDNATILVDVQWVRMSEGTLRTTRVEQTFQNGEEGGYRLVREKRVSGDLGLFGERVAQVDSPQHGDAYFPSRTIR
jgi:hypothetical protein